MASLERLLAASVAEVQQRKREDLDEWLDAAPVPPKRLKRKKMTDQAIVLHPQPVAIAPVLEFTPVQQQMIRDTYANGADQKEFEVLMEVAKLRRLNPLLRQIHFVSRWNKELGRKVWSAQVSVDGLRAIAERTGKYDGQDEAEFGPMANGFPEWARVKVYRKDWTRPAVGTAYWSEYVQTTKDGAPTRFWKEMPRVMLAKCAEAIAMRKAFPEDMGGLYVDEEMQQADNAPQLTEVSPHRDSPDAKPAAVDRGDYHRAMEHLAECEAAVFDPGCTWETMTKWRGRLGSKGQPAPLGQRLSDMYRGDLSGEERKTLSALWNRVDRKLTQLEGKLKPPPVEASFIDPPEKSEMYPDEAAMEAFAPGVSTDD